MIEEIRERIPEDLIGIPLVGVWLDLVLNSLDLVVELAGLVVGTVQLWLPILSNLSRLSQIFDWIPAGSMQTAILVGVTILTGSYIVRFVGRVQRRLSNS